MPQQNSGRSSRHQRASQHEATRATARERSVGIIGFGDFGRFLVTHLRPHFALQVWDQRQELAARAHDLGVSWTSLADCAACDVVIPAVPVQDLEPVLRLAAPYVRPGVLWVDVASVKARPIELMRRYLPTHCRLAASHPMFGPQSGKHGITGLKVVLCPVRGRSGLRHFLETVLALEVLEMTAEEHDRQMAYIQGLTHWVARALREIHMPDLQLATPAYRHLLSIEEILRQDTDALFLTIQRENPFASEARDELRTRLVELEQWINAASQPRGDSE